MSQMNGIIGVIIITFKKIKMSVEEKITLKFILESSKSEIDLRWKLGKYIENGDVSFLGNKVIDLNKEIKDSEKVSASVGSE